MTVTDFKNMVLSFPGVAEAPHFDRTAFKVPGKRIFATLHEESGSANIRLSPTDQEEFSKLSKQYIFAIPNKWGLQGWTTFELAGLEEEIVQEALMTAYSSS